MLVVFMLLMPVFSLLFMGMMILLEQCGFQHHFLHAAAGLGIETEQAATFFQGGHCPVQGGVVRLR